MTLSIDYILASFSNVISYYSHFIGHLLSRYRRISDCLYSIVYGQTGRYAPYRACVIIHLVLSLGTIVPLAYGLGHYGPSSLHSGV